MSSFENLRIVDNFYQTSLFFPMPTVVISTLCEDGSTSLGRIRSCSRTTLPVRIFMQCC